MHLLLLLEIIKFFYFSFSSFFPYRVCGSVNAFLDSVLIVNARSNCF